MFKGIILASQSPRRQVLLKQMGVSFTTIPSGLAELPPVGEAPGAYAARIALEKAVKVAEQHPDHLVIGADTVVSNGEWIMGKPANRNEAAIMLSRLSGRWHEVWTGLCVFCLSGKIEVVKAVRTAVLFRRLSQQEIEDYVDTGEPMDKAGAYAIQGLGKSLVREIQGSYHNVVGLPTVELGKILNDLGALDALVSDGA